MQASLFELMEVILNKYDSEQEVPTKALEVLEQAVLVELLERDPNWGDEQ